MPNGNNGRGILDASLQLLLGLPVELRRRDFAFMERTTLGSLPGSAQKLPPGSYIATLTLTSTLSVSHEFPVGEGGQFDILAFLSHLAARPAVAEFLSQYVIQDTVGRAPGWLAQAIEALARPGAWLAALAPGRGNPGQVAPNPPAYVVKARLLAVSRDACAPLPLPLSAMVLSQQGGGATVALSAADGTGTALVQFLRKGYAALNVVMPPGARLEVSAPDNQEESSAVLIRARLGVDLIDQMVGFRSAGRLSEFVACAASFNDEHLSMAGTPGAAYAAAYGALQSRPRREAAEAVARIIATRPDAPDSLILTGELSALDGRHEAALESFVEASHAGLPILSYGMSVLIDRLRFYDQAAAGRPGLPGVPSAAAEPAAWAQRYGLFTNFSEPLLTFTGLDPLKPDDELLAAGPLDGIAAAVIKLRQPVGERVPG